jgi:hypothetical protein
VAHQRLVEVLAVQAGVAPQRLRALLQLGEVVDVPLQEVVHLLGRQARAVHARQVVPVVEAQGQRLGRLAGVLVRVVQREHRPREPGRGGRQLAHLLRHQLVALEERVAERLHHLGREAGVVLRGEGGEVQLEDLR